MWAEDDIAIFERGVAGGLSAAQIAAALGHRLTRNAVIGRAFRHGLSLKQRLDGPAKPFRGELRRPVTTRRRAPAPELSPEPAPAGNGDRAAAARAFFAQTPPLRVALLLVRPEQCRFPLGDPSAETFAFCGLPRARLLQGRPYCAGHDLIAYAERVARDRPSLQPVRRVRSCTELIAAAIGAGTGR